MATLTTSWKSYASSSVTISGATVTFYLEAKYNSQSTANNTTVINTRLRSTINSGSALRGAGYSFTCSYCTGKSGSEVWSFANEVILSSGDKTITHNSDGKKTLSLSATAKNTYWGINKSLSANVSLPTINRKANITSAPNFNDTQNPTINYSNPAGNNVSSLQARIENSAGGTAYVDYRNISKTGTSYTFNFTEAERNNLIYQARNTNTLAVKFVIKTVIGGTTLYSTVNKNLSIINANPTETTTFLETNQDVIDLLDSSSADIIVQNVSQVKMTSASIAYKSATITKVLFKNGASESPATTSPYEATITPTTNTFTTTVTDSRTNSVTNNYTKTMIEYLPVNIDTCTFKRVNPTSSNILLNAEIRYKQTTIGETTNVPTIKWKLGEDGQLNTLTSSDYTIDTENDKIYIYNYEINNILPYTDEGTFYLYVNDILTSDEETNNKVSRGIPTFEAGSHDFQVNGELYIANEDRTNKQTVFLHDHPVGSVFITDTNTNPENTYGGTWELVDKVFKSRHGGGSGNSMFTRNTTNTSAHSFWYTTAGHTVTVEIQVTPRIAFDDSTIEWGNVNLTQLGITQFSHTGYDYGWSDGGQGIAMVGIRTNGQVNSYDVLTKTSGGSIPAGSEELKVVHTQAIPYYYMLDSFCDKFYWKRTA